MKQKFWRGGPVKLRGGERKILKVLKTGKKSFSELKEETGLSASVLSDYLKRLQKLEKIARDIDSRKYYLLEEGRIDAISPMPWYCSPTPYTELIFCLNSPLFPEFEESKGNPWYETGLLVDLRFLGKPGSLKRAYKRAFRKIDEKVLQSILKTMEEEGLLPTKAKEKGFNWEEIAPEEWENAFKTLFGECKEAVCIITLHLDGLLPWLRVPGARKLMQELFENITDEEDQEECVI